MPTKLRDVTGSRGAVLVAITFVYFLIFAQFGFLARLAELGIAEAGLNSVMAAMAAGGILLSFLTPLATKYLSPGAQLQLGFAICAMAAALSCLSLGIVSVAVIAFLIGAGLGVVTVTLVTYLPLWAGQNLILMVGIGTGLGYFVCNIPPVFTASPRHQAMLAVLLCVAGALLAMRTSAGLPQQVASKDTPLPFARALGGFTALVWLDSAAFYIIQHAATLKAGTWMGDVHLWTNGCIHLLAALIAALLLRSHRTGLVLSCAVAALGVACTLLLNPAAVLPASLFYPAGVSFYSVALVAYPSFLGGAVTVGQRARQAGWIYAIAGWVGSALGIGMGQHLGHVPSAFVAAAGTVVLLPSVSQLLQARMREVVALCAVLCAAFLVYRLLPSNAAVARLTPVERGRQVYIAEGCIHCHSQYVRPHSPDVEMWGPVESLKNVHGQRPPLIGNRRQGPDLAEVGLRRSALWLKAHLIDPAEVSAASIMPPYPFLFRDQRGDDLVAYLSSLHSGDSELHLREVQAWRPSISSVAGSDSALGEHIYGKYCATCHDTGGATRVQWKSSFKQLPTNLSVGPFTYIKVSDSVADRTGRIAQIAKFGIAGTDMPGHEYLSDHEIASLSLWLTQRMAQPVPHS